MRAGVWAKAHPQEVAQVAAEYWNQDPELINYAMNTPEGRIVFDQFLPKQAEIKDLAELMRRFDLIPSSDVDGLVSDRFASQVSLVGVTSLDSLFP